MPSSSDRRRSGRWSASTKAPAKLIRRSASANPGGRWRRPSNASITSIAATAPSISLSSLTQHRSWRRVKVTGRRTADDFAVCVREFLVDVDFPGGRPHPRRPRQPLHPHRCRSLRRIPTGRSAARFSGGSSSTTRPSTPAGSTWRDRDRRRSKANVSIAASKAGTGSSPRSTSGSLSRNQKRRSNQLDVLHRQGQNQNGACLSRSLAQKSHAISVQRN